MKSFVKLVILLICVIFLGLGAKLFFMVFTMPNHLAGELCFVGALLSWFMAFALLQIEV